MASKKRKSTGNVHTCAVTLGRRGGKATAAKKRARSRAAKKGARKRKR